MENLNLNNILEINPYKDLQGKCEITFKEISLSHDSPSAESPLEFSEIDTINGAKLQAGLAELTFSEIRNQDLPTVTGLDIYIRKASDTKLGSLLTTLPWGLLKKNYTGIGATTLELNSPRNSIIVVPTKALAYNKYLSGINSETGVAKYCYVGSTISDLPNTTPQHIQTYLHNDTISHKKLLVVTDSLKKVIEAIGPDIYQNYFLLLDEIDIYQSDSTFRPALEDAIDYYFNFDPQHRSMVSATMQEFSHPLIQKEPLINLIYTLPTYAKKDHLLSNHAISAIHTDNPHQIAVEKILELLREHPNEKIVIAYNKLTAIRQIIALLPEEIRSQCGILCSEASRQNAGEYYQELTANNTLPLRITFLTCAYFAGVDIAERFHLISISDATKIYTMLSTARLTQIAGRCRHPEGVFSETVIYSTKQYDFGHTPESLREFYLEMAQDLANYANSADVLQRRYPRALPSDFLTIKNSVAEKSSYKAFGESPVTLIRTNIEGVSVPAYMNIDAIYERLQLRLNLYSTQSELPAALQEEGHIVITQELLLPHTNEQVRVEAEIEAALDDTADQERVQIIAELQRLHHSGELNERNLIQLRRSKSRKGQEFINRFQQLYPYLAFDELISREELTQIATGLMDLIML